MRIGILALALLPRMATRSSARMAAHMKPSAAARMLEQPAWAVAGDVLNAAKPASEVVATLRGQGIAGRTVALVNPRDASGECYTSVAEIDAPVDVLNLCINAHAGLTLLEQAAAKGVTSVFVQPGASSPQIEAFCAEHGIELFHGCVMMELHPH